MQWTPDLAAPARALATRASFAGRDRNAGPTRLPSSTRSYFGSVAVAASALVLGCSDPSSPPPAPGSMASFSILAAASRLGAEALASGTQANGVNQNGDAVGYGPGAVSCTTTSLAKVWHADGSVVVLPTGTHCGGQAWGINKYGVINGQLYGPPGAGLWTPKNDGTGAYTLQDLGPADGHLVRTLGGINDAGEIIGWYSYAKLYWRTSTTPWTPMAVPAGATDCQLRRGINNLGVITGTCTVGGLTTGYYWTNHTATPAALPRPKGSGMVFTKEINDAGVIVGWVYGSQVQAVKWVPNAGGAYTSVTVLPDAGHGGAAYGVTKEGTIAGAINSSSDYAIPVVWPASGGYQILPFFGRASYGEAEGIAASASGAILAVGYQNGTQALRWK